MKTADERKLANQKYIAEKLDPYMNELMVAVLTEKPRDVLKFMAEWVHSQKVSQMDMNIEIPKVR